MTRAARPSPVPPSGRPVRGSAKRAAKMVVLQVAAVLFERFQARSMAAQNVASPFTRFRAKQRREEGSEEKTEKDRGEGEEHRGEGAKTAEG